MKPKKRGLTHAGCLVFVDRYVDVLDAVMYRIELLGKLEEMGAKWDVSTR